MRLMKQITLLPCICFVLVVLAVGCTKQTSRPTITVQKQNIQSKVTSGNKIIDQDTRTRFENLITNMRLGVEWYDNMKPNEPLQANQMNMIEFYQEGSVSLTQDYGSYRFTDSVKPYEKLTNAEKLLLERVKARPGSSAPYLFGLSDISVKLLREYANSGITHWDTNPIYKEIPSNALLESSLSSEKQMLLLDPYFSPVTGKLMEYYRPEFSSGNMFIRVVTEPEVLKVLRKVGLAEGEENVLFAYYRVYGESEIIAEGVIMGSRNS